MWLYRTNTSKSCYMIINIIIIMRSCAMQPDVVASYVPRISRVASDWVRLLEHQRDANGRVLELREFINRFTSEGN